MFLISPFLFEESQYGYGPVYHGGSWDGKSAIKLGRGALGIGAYFTPDRSIAEAYAKESGGRVVEAFLSLRNPLVIDSTDRNEHPCVKALVSLGMPAAKAEKLVERTEEKYGYMGGEIKKLALEQGFDGLVQKMGGKVREVVIWNALQAQAITG